MELDNSIEKLEEFLFSKGFSLPKFKKFVKYNFNKKYIYKNYQILISIDNHFALSEYSEINKKEETNNQILTFEGKFDLKNLKKIKSIISSIINN